MTEPIKQFSRFPLLIEAAFKEVTELPPFHVEVDLDFKPINRLDYDVYTLDATYKKDEFLYRLRNLRNDSIIYSWSYSEDFFSGSSEHFKVAHPFNPALLPDKSIVGMLRASCLFRLDKNSNLLWQNDSIVVHHALNLSHDGNIWVCGKKEVYTKNSHSYNYTSFNDDAIFKVDVDTGEILFQESISNIFVRNGYHNIVHGYSNDNLYGWGLEQDFFHLNDIQPILSDGPHWKRDDLLLSLRNRSIIVHYRPSSMKIIRIIGGPFLNQHDVDVISSNEISIFNNNRAATYDYSDEFSLMELQKDSTITDDYGTPNLSNPPLLDLKSSNVITYSLSDSIFKYHPSRLTFEEKRIYTQIEGLQEFLRNGDLFVESSQEGKRFIFRGNDVIYQNYAHELGDGESVERPHWTRIYENLEFLER